MDFSFGFGGFSRMKLINYHLFMLKQPFLKSFLIVMVTVSWILAASLIQGVLEEKVCFTYSVLLELSLELVVSKVSPLKLKISMIFSAPPFFVHKQ